MLVTNSDITTASTLPIYPTNSVEMSTEIGEIALALSLAQGELEAANKGQSGYGYNYSDLTSVINTAKPVLVKHGLAVTQLVGTNGDKPSITTILVHKSGQFFKSFADLPLIEMKGVNNAQITGAVYSYLRRYAYQAILGMSSEDNDASSNGFKKKGGTSFTKKAEPAKEAIVKPEAQKFRRKKKVEVEDEI